MPPSCKVHTWAPVATGRVVKARYLRDGRKKKTSTEEVVRHCVVCGEPAPLPKRVIRLVVLPRRVTCPYGWNDSDGERNLHDCYLDSITPGHRCVDPERTGATRCPEVKKFRKLHGWRTFYKLAVEEYARYGVLHTQFPVQVLYSALDRKGTKWMAVNRFSGQRVEVTFDPTGEKWTYDALTGWTVTRDHAVRVTPEGEPIEADYSITSLASGKARVREHVWINIPSRQDWPKCTCINCKEYAKSQDVVMSKIDLGHVTGKKKVQPQAEVPQSEKPIGDPATCGDCRFARCRVHRMVFLPTHNSMGQRIVAHTGDWLTRQKAPPTTTPRPIPTATKPVKKAVAAPVSLGNALSSKAERLKSKKRKKRNSKRKGDRR